MDWFLYDNGLRYEKFNYKPGARLMFCIKSLNMKYFSSFTNQTIKTFFSYILLHFL